MKVFFLILSFLTISYNHICAEDHNLKKSIKTIYPSKDWVVSDFIVTDYGACAEPGFDNRKPFQAAIDAAYASGGGVVYIPAGNYEFHSETTGYKTVRVRQGDKEIKKQFEYNYVLKLHTGVQLRGDWADPEENGNKVLGTILEVRVGKDATDYDEMVESWWNDSQAGNALRTSYTSVADRFIELNASTGLTNLSIWYPEQQINDIRPYPWTLFQTRGDSVTLEHITLVNSYNGFKSSPSELHYVVDSYITALNKGIEIHVCTDIGRIENVTISPEFWAESGLPGAPSAKALRRHTLDHGLAFQMHRSDWEYISGLKIKDYRTGIWIGKEPGFKDAPNAQLYEVEVENCCTALYVEDVNPYGILISNSMFKSAVKGIAAYFYKDFSTSVQFNSVSFDGPVCSDGVGGVISFDNCTFLSQNHPSISLTDGNVLLSQCRFMYDNEHVVLGKDVDSFSSINSGYDKSLNLNQKCASTKVTVEFDDDFFTKPMERYIKTDIDVYPKPQSNVVYHADFPRASGYNDISPTVDVSSHIQNALDLLALQGGGTLYLPAGRYLVEHPIKLPGGTELRGSWDVQHHTMGGGTALFTHYDGGGLGEKGESLIQLEANSGLNGIVIGQLNMICDGFDITNPRKTPFLIQGQGERVYVVNTTICIGDKGIDMASYNTDGHYINYLGGALLRAGIWVGGGSQGGYIRNMQFNPHYCARLPKGKQGYPVMNAARFIQSNCSALKFADVKEQTIFNNFVFGSVYGIHFLRDSITGNYPGKMTMVGHGSDGCTFALFVEDADENTEIIGINSELVNTRIEIEPVRTYVLMGKEKGRIDDRAVLTLYNSAMWGSPTDAAIINGGTVRLHQANLTRSGVTGIDVRGGKTCIYTTYFQQHLKKGESYFSSHQDSGILEIRNNYYRSDIFK